MKIRLLAIGNKMPDWIKIGCADYLKRFPRTCSVELVEIPMPKRHKATHITKLISQESDALLAAQHPRHQLIALDSQGSLYSTKQLAQQWHTWETKGQSIDMMIGGPDGLSTACLQAANQHWSLGPLTLPHPLVRVILLEQLYRAMSIVHHHPYHRD